MKSFLRDCSELVKILGARVTAGCDHAEWRNEEAGEEEAGERGGEPIQFWREQ